MADNDDGSEDRYDRGIRSSKRIKAGLLRSAWDKGLSAYPVIQEIQARVARSREMPPEHVEILKDIIPGQAKAVMRLNAQARYAGLATRFHEVDPNQTPDETGLFMDQTQQQPKTSDVMPTHLTLQ